MEDDNEIREMATRFEARLYGYRMDRKGDFILTLHINADDVPGDIVKDRIGQRYIAALARLDDQDNPMPGESYKTGRYALKVAVMLCKDLKFQQWLATNGWIDELNEESAIVFVREHCGVESRSDIQTNEKAQQRLLSLRDEFAAYLRSR